MPAASFRLKSAQCIDGLATARRAFARLAITGLTGAVLTCAPGCIVRQMRDELVAVNASLEQSNQALSASNQTLVDVRDDLKQVNERLTVVEQHLGTTHDRLAVLDSIEASLKAIDAHLTSLRQTIENIDTRIPFLKFADDRPMPPATTQPPE